MIDKIAAIIEPYAWECYYASLNPYKENRGAYASLGETYWYMRMYTQDVRTVEQAVHWWCKDADPYDEAYTLSQFRTSLIKAQEIMKVIDV